MDAPTGLACTPLWVLGERGLVLAAAPKADGQ